MINENKSHNNPLEIIPDETIRKIVSQMLLDSINDLSNDLLKAIIPIISDYVISFRKKLVSNIEFKLPKTAAKLSNIPLTTLYTWIAKGSIKLYSIDKTNYISMTELNGYIKNSKYNKYKYDKDSKKSEPIEDS